MTGVQGAGNVTSLAAERRFWDAPVEPGLPQLGRVRDFVARHPGLDAASIGYTDALGLSSTIVQATDNLTLAPGLTDDLRSAASKIAALTGAIENGAISPYGASHFDQAYADLPSLLARAIDGQAAAGGTSELVRATTGPHAGRTAALLGASLLALAATATWLASSNNARI
jgi:hypothetical protein